MSGEITQRELRSDDEAWIVIDKDHWTDEQLLSLMTWSQQDPRFHLAVSNPQFEY